MSFSKNNEISLRFTNLDDARSRAGSYVSRTLAARNRVRFAVPTCKSPRVAGWSGYVRLPAGGEVVEDNDTLSLGPGQERAHKMTANKTGPARDKGPFPSAIKLGRHERQC
jgi:hypothetical protein